VIELDPQKPRGYIDRGWVYVLDDQLDKAGSDFDTALEIQGNNALALVGRGVVKSRTGQPTDGSADLRTAEKLEPGIFDQVRALGIK
jgi:Tfp pilus assembly protein PilF